jgi:signal transduction histidine kinase
LRVTRDWFHVQTNNNSNRESKDFRVLVMTPTGRDSALICQLLDRVRLPCQSCNSWEDLLTEIRSGAGSIIIAEEALTAPMIDILSGVMRDQPAWSDFPLLLLTVAGAVSTSSLRRLDMQKPLGNVLLLERPIRPETLVSTVQSALRARGRQYQLRDQLLQQQQAEEALRKSEKLAVAGRIAASIAHEINNPLESVTNLVYLSSSSDRLPDIRQYLATAQQELARVSAIATHTLRFYREPNGPGPVNVADVLDSVLLLFCSRLTTANVKVQKQCEQVPAIMGLPGELRQLFANLIGNALDAMRGGGTLTLRLRTACEFTNGRRAGVRVVIADTGQGISSDKKGKIFEPFFTTKGQTGTGLGLWISSEIIQKHRGTVRVKSRVYPQKSGTVFSIFLPDDSFTAGSNPVRATG